MADLNITQRKCEHCDAAFIVKRARPGRGRFCSHKCQTGFLKARWHKRAVDNFWRRGERSANGCIEWSGKIGTHGYGALNFRGRQATAHRLAWTLTYGAPAKGLHVLHRCDNRKCFNIDHLFLGTHQDNMIDANIKGRDAHGETHMWARWSDERVANVRSANGTTAEIAERFGMPYITVYSLRRGLHRRHA